jgi:hypothetical protein
VRSTRFGFKIGTWFLVRSRDIKNKFYMIY